MKPEDFLNSRMLDEMYGDRHIHDDLATADGIVTAVCAGGALLILVLVILGVII